MSSYLTYAKVREIQSNHQPMTPDEHLAKAAELLAGSYERDNAPFTPYTYSWVPPTEAKAMRAQAHATLALAMLAADREQPVTVGVVEIRPAVPR